MNLSNDTFEVVKSVLHGHATSEEIKEIVSRCHTLPQVEQQLAKAKELLVDVLLDARVAHPGLFEHIRQFLKENQ